MKQKAGSLLSGETQLILDCFDFPQTVLAGDPRVQNRDELFPGRERPGVPISLAAVDGLVKEKFDGAGFLQ